MAIPFDEAKEILTVDINILSLKAQSYEMTNSLKHHIQMV